MMTRRLVSSRAPLFSLAGAGTLAFLTLAAPVAEAQTVPTGTIALISRQMGQCVRTNSAQLNLQMVTWRCSDSPGHQWTMEPVTGTGSYRIVSRLNPTMCLAVQGSSTADGAKVVQSTCNGAASQTWTPTPNGNWVQLVASHSGKCLNVAQRVPDSGAQLNQAACVSEDRQRWTISAAPLPSAWSAKFPFTLVAVAVANMPDGRVMMWSAYDRFNYTAKADYGKTYTSIFDPQTGTATETLVSDTQHDMFCPGTTMLPDGRLLVNGGSSSAKTTIFDPSTGTWSTSGVMSIPRGYQANTLISNGEVFTLGGSWSGGQGNKHAEVWSNVTNPTGAWRALPGVPIDQFIGPDPRGVYRGDNQLWLQAWVNRWVFHAGPSAQMHWIDTKGTGQVVDAGPRGTDTYAMNGNAVMYDKGKILTIGGAPAYDGGYATDNANLININVTPPAPVGVTALSPMVFPRAMQNSVALPNGQVVIVGGMNTAKVFSDAGAVMMAELWDPVTQKFTRLSAMTTPRPYHGVALLLLDGRVFVGGGGLCGSCNVNHPDAEILTPPYLLNADGSLAPRPAITDAPTSAKRNMTITVKTNMWVSTFALVRMSAATHSINNDQRRIPLPIAGGGVTSGYQLKIPWDPGYMLPGNYMLFALQAGRPSYAKVINIQ